MNLIETPVASDRIQVANAQIKPFAYRGHAQDELPEWKNYEKTLFRFFFIFFAIQVIPLDAKYYQNFFAIDWFNLHFRNIFYIGRYAPSFISNAPGFGDWIIIAVVATIGTIAWSYVDKERKEYNTLYYWLRVVLRYRLAVALLAYGFLKFYPMQMPDPSISNLNTNYGDFDAWKIFSLSTGIVPGYQSFLGLVEISAALLLLYRKTASIGAFIIIPFTGNVVMSNLAYEGGEYIYGLYLVNIALFLLAFDARRLINLTSLDRPTLPNRFKPSFKKGWLRYGRLSLKSIFIFLFVFVYDVKVRAAYDTGGFQFPQAKGLSKAEGVYVVSEFKLNDTVLPPSFDNPIRWEDVVFEKWATLSIRSGMPVEVYTARTEEIFLNDAERIYELSGSQGRHYYHYSIDSVNEILTLQNRNSNHSKDKLILRYHRPDDSKIILSGTNEKNDSIHVVLQKLNKKYLLKEVEKHGRRRPLKM
jgi:hypothetical protein